MNIETQIDDSSLSDETPSTPSTQLSEGLVDAVSSIYEDVARQYKAVQDEQIVCGER
jgi:hypothetical protein